MESAESKLWLVFTYYSIRGNASDPERMTCAALCRLCEDCELLGRGLSRHDVETACAYLRRRNADRWRGLTYSEFATVLAALAGRALECETRDESLTRVLTQCVFPLAKRRRHVDVRPMAADVRPVRDWLDREVSALFAFYGETMSWHDFTGLARDLGLHARFSAADLADAYVASTDVDRRLRHDGFWDLLLRLALRGAGDEHPPRCARRLKGLLLYVYRQRVQLDNAPSELPTADKHLRSDLLLKLDKFKHRFKLLWQRDGFPDYLAQPSRPGEARRERRDPTPTPPGSLLATLRRRSRPADEDIHLDDLPLNLVDLDDDSRHRLDDGQQHRDPHQRPPLEIFRDVADIGDPRFTVDDLQRLIELRPAVGEMLRDSLAAITPAGPPAA
mmetsp:Transcript_8486/g.26472  ORF Transcript_8486/g.26472 Transcript_8486/m.26472 type:complete len:389 (+) Transcript_8486:399-1565(+)|eukprot:CAMPEP_0197396622 /NCGR_PEP_ID=MMETSP1165-20131217/9968_1 /TAXON_ID=284809 /ORGANISM="Chrysocystis fragilis, Strain CCMP3189" /LENGTH=388 /DNA_ID=CAMNT_0042922471 /DNA_START=226 /DNA_END=1392 /DNA_ORIENTATION=-